MWPDDIVNQVNTMMENVRYLVGTENTRLSGHNTLIKLGDFEHFKVYFRRIADYQIIKDLLVETWHIPP
jgi:glutathionyl-hydroquinone reductase